MSGGVEHRPVASPLAAVAELRARLFWRRLRGRGGVEGFALLSLFVAALAGSVAFAVFVGAASLRAARAGGGLDASLAVTAMLFGVWQTWTAVSLSLADRDAVDLRRFLPFPVRPGRVYSLGIATAVIADPFAVFWIVVLGGAFTGAALGRPGPWLVPLAALLVLFATATVALVTLVQEVAARLARSRHFRLYAMGAALAGWGILVGFAAAGAHAPRAAIAVLRRVQWLAFPAALASAGARRLFDGHVAAALPWLGALAVAALVTGLLAYRVALGTARAGGEGAPPMRAAARPGLLGRLADPLLEKELRQLARHPVLRLYAIVLPVLSGLVAWRLAERPMDGFAGLAPALPFVAIAAYLHLIVQPFWLNAFGWDRGGARLPFLAPVRPVDVLRAKNRAAFLVSAALFAACASSAIVAGEAPPVWALVGAAALHAGMAPGLYALGNLVSILNPRSAAFGAQRAGALSSLSALAGMAIVTAVAVPFSLPFVVAVITGEPWALPAGWALTGVAAWGAYRLTLPRAGRLLERRRDELLADVCGDEA